jgi:mxaA protein
MRVVAGALLIALATTASALPLDTVEPRPFGYTVGDVLERRVLVDPERDGRVDPASLPRPGRNGRWFQLREASAVPGGVRLLYQVVNTPMQPDAENLPSLRLSVIGRDGQVRPADIGPFTVTMAPVTHVGPNEVIDAGDLRPDLDPRPIDTSARRLRVLAVAGALAAVVVALLAPALVRRLGWRPAGPFARAARALRRSRLRGDDEAARARALRRLHEALDEAAGRTVALDNVELLFRANPRLEPARGAVQGLLADSRAAFFGQAPPPARARLASVAAELAALERRG